MTTPGPAQLFVAKLDGAGQHLWSKNVAGGDSFIVPAFDGLGNLFLAGTFSSSLDLGGAPLTTPFLAAFLARLDAAGNPLWSKSFESPGGGAPDILSLSLDGPAGAEHVVIAGDSQGVGVDFGGGPIGGGVLAGLVADFDANGVPLWSKATTTGPNGLVLSGKAAADSAGNVFLVGVFSGTIDLGGGPFTAPQLAMYIVKLDGGGSPLWSKSFGDWGLRFGYDVVATFADGSVAFATNGGEGTVDYGGGPVSTTMPESDVVKLDANGNLVWHRHLFGALVHDLRVDALGRVLLTGRLWGTGDFGGGPIPMSGDEDAYVAVLDSAGAHVFSRGFGDAALQWGLGVAPFDANHVLVAGTFDGALSVGCAPALQAAVPGELFVAKILIP